VKSYFIFIKFIVSDIIVTFILLLISCLINKRVFIISNPYGRWGNRLMLFTYMIAWAKQHDAIVLNPSFVEYSRYFKNFDRKVLGIIPNDFFRLIKIPEFLIDFINESFKRISYRKINLMKIFCFDLETENEDYESVSFQNFLSSSKVIFFHGFLFGKRNFNIIKFQRNYFNSLFDFTDDIKIRSEEIIKSIQKSKIIGVCMRQGDYKNHFGGRLYLNDNEYKILIDRIKELFGNHYGVFVACEEKKSALIHENAYFNYEDPAVNLCTLSKCDYLIGPASTFMTWASFLNNVATCYIDKDNFKSKELLFLETTF